MIVTANSKTLRHLFRDKLLEAAASVRVWLPDTVVSHLSYMFANYITVDREIESIRELQTKQPSDKLELHDIFLLTADLGVYKGMFLKEEGWCSPVYFSAYHTCYGDAYDLAHKLNLNTANTCRALAEEFNNIETVMKNYKSKCL